MRPVPTPTSLLLSLPPLPQLQSDTWRPSTHNTELIRCITVTLQTDGCLLIGGGGGGLRRADVGEGRGSHAANSLACERPVRASDWEECGCGSDRSRYKHVARGAASRRFMPLEQRCHCSILSSGRGDTDRIGLILAFQGGDMARCLQLTLNVA